MPEAADRFGREQFLVLRVRQKALGDDHVADRRALPGGFGDDGAGRFVADLGDERRGGRARGMDVRGAALLVGLDALHAVAAQRLTGVRKAREDVEQAGRDERQERVELEAAEAAGGGDGGVVAHHEQRHLAHGFWDHGVDLAGHDA